MLDCLLRQASVAVRVSRRGGSDLGRALSKLCSSETSLRSLGEAATVLSQTLVGSSLIPASVRLPDSPLADAASWQDVSASTISPDITASRIKWELPPTFDPLPYLPARLQAAFIDPESLRLPQEDWPAPPPPARVHASQAELESLLAKLDAAGALALVSRSEVPDWSEACGLFRVAKDADHDRLILNPTVVNGRMRSIADATLRLGAGFLLTRIVLDSHEWLELCSDDLREFYYTFQVSRARARRNVLRVVLRDSFARTLSCWSSDLAGSAVCPALSVLAMGDNLAVEIAQSAHEGLLRSVGALEPSERVVARRPLPRGPFYEMLNIDDHTSLLRVSHAGTSHSAVASSSERRDLLAFEASEREYKRVGLVQHQGKRTRRATHATLVGAEVEGRIGVISAPLVRLCALTRLTLLQCQLPRTTLGILQSLVGSWTQAFLYRRPLLSVFTKIFVFISSLEGHDPAEPLVLPPYIRDELLLCCALGPFAKTNLRARSSSFLYGTDASLVKGAVVRAAVEEPVSR
jgi:hypothetical protein